MSEKWTTRGFESFRSGTFGNAGQNLYVSKAGVLQRIYQYDLDQDGYFDMLFCNSQNHCESAPVFYWNNPWNPTAKEELPVLGGRTGISVDLTGDGYDDIVVAPCYDGASTELNAVVYFGGPDGYSERRMNYLPTPASHSVAAGRFNGSDRPALAFTVRKKVRIFYPGSLGIEARHWVDLPEISAVKLAAGDLDGDGYDELIARDADGKITVYWGSPDGVVPENATVLDYPCATKVDLNDGVLRQSEMEQTDEPEPLLQCLVYRGEKLLSIIDKSCIRLLRCDKVRNFSVLWELPAEMALQVAVADDCGFLVAARAEGDTENEHSYFFPCQADGSPGKAVFLSTRRASSCAMADWNGDGKCEFFIGQSHTGRSFTHCSRLFLTPDAEPVELPGEDTRDVLVTNRPDGTPGLVMINHHSRSLVGHNSVRLYRGGPDGYDPERFYELPGWCAVEGLYADINDDGIGDLIVANCAENSLWLDPGSFIHYNSKDGFNPEKMVAIPTKAAHGCCCADIDRDGYLELLFCSFLEPEIIIYHQDENGFDLENPQRIPLEFEGKLYHEPRWIYLVDLNNDGYLDLVIPMIDSDRSWIMWGGPDGFSEKRSQALAVFRGACARAADLSGNGYPDLVVGGHMPSPSGGIMPPMGPHDSFAYIYWNGPEGISETRRTLLKADGVNSMAIGDFNGDGALDLFVGNYHDGYRRDIPSFIYWNRKGRGFSSLDKTDLLLHSVSGAMAGDFNGDGLIDLAVANHKTYGDHQGPSQVFWNTGSGIVSHVTTELPGWGPHGISSVEPGNQLDRSDSEYYTSVEYTLKEDVKKLKADIEAELYPGTAVRIRFSSSDGTWSRWLNSGEALEFSAAAGTEIRYQLELYAKASLRSPRITAVDVEFN